MATATLADVLEAARTLSGEERQRLVRELDALERQEVQDLQPSAEPLAALRALSGAAHSSFTDLSTQLSPAGRPYPDLARVLATFEGIVETPYTVAFWLVSPQDLLEGETPAAWLRDRRDPERLHEAARRAAAALAH